MPRTSAVVLSLCLTLTSPALAQGTGGAAGSNGSGTSTGSPGGRSGAPVATQQNPIFSNQPVPPATSTTNTNITGRTAVGTSPSGVPIGGVPPATSTTNTNTTGRAAVGTAPNGVPIGDPGSGKGSPQNPW